MSRSAAWLALALGLLISSIVTSLPGIALSWAHHAVTSEAPDDPGQLVALSRYEAVLRLADQRRATAGRDGLSPAWRRAEALAHAAAGDVEPLLAWIEERSPWASEREIQALLVRGFDALEHHLQQSTRSQAQTAQAADQPGPRPWVDLATAARRARPLHAGLERWINGRCQALDQQGWQPRHPDLSRFRIIRCFSYGGDDCSPHRAGELAEASTSP